MRSSISDTWMALRLRAWPRRHVLRSRTALVVLDHVRPSIPRPMVKNKELREEAARARHRIKVRALARERRRQETYDKWIAHYGKELGDRLARLYGFKP